MALDIATVTAGLGRPSLHEALSLREKAGKRIRVGLVGVGQMGTDIVVQIAQMQGIEIVVAVDMRPERVETASKMAGDASRRPLVCSSAADASRAITQGRLAVVTAPELACQAPEVDVIIDATGNPSAGAAVALMAIAAKKHIVMMNVECDVTVGAYLATEAAKAGVVYTLGAGDEPTAAMELINFVRGLGYPVVAAGKGKNNPFRIDAIPDDYVAEAKSRNMNPRMLVEFVDGSKTMVEMVAIANAAGLVPDIPGMHGPAAPRDQLQNYFCPTEEGGLLSKKGCVDFTVAKGVAPGVFAVAEMRHPRVRERMNDLHLGPGPYYSFFRPYHLTSLEVPLSAAAAVLFGECHMRPLAVPTSEVGCIAKKDLKPGDKLDNIGEYCYRGYSLTRADAEARNALPIGLAQNGIVTRAIGKGELLTLQAVTPDAGAKIVQVRRTHDARIRALTG